MFTVKTVNQKERLTPFQINTTIPSYTQSLLDVPARTIPMGEYKLEFTFEATKENI